MLDLAYAALMVGGLALCAGLIDVLVRGERAEGATDESTGGAR